MRKLREGVLFDCVSRDQRAGGVVWAAKEGRGVEERLDRNGM